MHFGYYRAGMNPLRREAMLEQMNAEVLKRLKLEGIGNRSFSTLAVAWALRCAVLRGDCRRPGCSELRGCRGRWKTHAP